MAGKAAKPPKARVYFSKGLAQKICGELAKGRPWSQVCQDRGMPSHATFFNWVDAKPEFAVQVAKARAAGAEACADKALEVAAKTTKETVQQDRLHVSTLMKRAGMIGPKPGRAGKGGRADAAPEPEVVEVIIYARRFEKVVGEDGRAFLREIKPEGAE